MTSPEDELAQLFHDEAMRRIDAMDAALLEIEAGNAGAETLTSLFREAHTIKGAAGMVGQDDVRVVAHAVEDVLAVLRDQGTFPASLVPGLLRATGLLRSQVTGHGGPAVPVLDELAAARAALHSGTGTTTGNGSAAPLAGGPAPSPAAPPAAEPPPRPAEPPPRPAEPAPPRPAEPAPPLAAEPAPVPAAPPPAEPPPAPPAEPAPGPPAAPAGPARRSGCRPGRWTGCSTWSARWC